MSTLQESLSQWARFEPDYCRDCHSVQSILVDNRFCVISEEPTETDLALLLSCLLLAVVRQGLRVRLENDEESWYVELRDPDDPHWVPVSIAAIDEAAHALLAAYVVWLEKNYKGVTSGAT